MPMNKLHKLLPLFLLMGYLLVYWPAQLTAQGSNQAALVVRFGDDSVQTRCVTFDEPQISGYELLLRSGLPIIADVQGMGALVCSIDGTGCPAHDCLCQCRGSSCVYWSYWHQVDGTWQYSSAGASIYPVRHGSVEGWSWGPGGVTGAIAPPVIEFDTVCQAAATETPTPTAVPPTLTPTPMPTSTPSPTLAPEITFSADASTVAAGSCTNLRWRVANITAVYLNGIGVTGEETRQVCPTQTETYTLRVVRGSWEETRTLTIVVAPASATPATGNPTTTLTVSPVPAVTMPPAPATAVAATSTISDEQTAVWPATAVPASLMPSTLPPTPEILWVTVPPLPSPTPTRKELAALPPVTVAAPVAPATTGVTSETADTLPTYLSFLAIVLLLSLLIWHTRQRSNLA